MIRPRSFGLEGSPSWARQYAAAALVGLAYLGVDCLHKGASLLAAIGKPDRSQFYISLAASSAALLGFAITAASILTALGSGPRISWLREQEEFKQTRVVLIGSMHALALSTVVFTVMIIADTGASGCSYREAFAVAVATVVVTRLGWVLWLLNELLRLSLEDEKEAGGDPNPPMVEPLHDPEDATGRGPTQVEEQP